MSRNRSELLDPVSGTSLAKVGVKASGGWLLYLDGAAHLIASEPGVTTQVGSTDRIEVIDLAKPAAAAWGAAGSYASPGCLGVHGFLLTRKTVASDPPSNNNAAGFIGEKMRIVAHRLTDGEPQWEITASAPDGCCSPPSSTPAGRTIRR